MPGFNERGGSGCNQFPQHINSTHFQCDSTHRRFTSQYDTKPRYTFSLFIILTFYNVQKIIVQAINLLSFAIYELLITCLSTASIVQAITQQAGYADEHEAPLS